MTNSQHIHKRPLQILIVDDDEDCREFLAMSLEMQDVPLKVIQASDGEDAVKILDANQFDAVATDMNLPGMDGLALLNHIREKYDELPVILITGYSSVGTAVDALKMGAQDYLVKPLETADGLMGAILKAVDRHKLSKENKALQERLIRANKMESLADLAGGVAHDLNNILAPMLGLPDLIISEIQHTCKTCHELLSDTEGDLELMKISAQRAAAVVRDLTTSTKRGNYNTKPVNLNDIVNEYIQSQEFIELTRPRSDVTIKTELGHNLRTIGASVPHIIRAIANLTRNGLEAMNKQITGITPEKLELIITTSDVSPSEQTIGYELIPVGNYSVLQVSDSGAGMLKQDMDRIFEPFFTRKKQSRQSGSGLGLSVVHGVIKDHGGYIDIHTEIGKGTTFSLYFPETTEQGIPDSPHATVRRGTERILIVDDEPASRTVGERFLTSLGYRVTLAISGRNAVGLLKKKIKETNNTPFDLLLLDMIMEEDFDGLTTLTTIRQLCPDIPAIIASGHAPTDRVQKALDMGAAWLPKPFTIDALSTIVRNILD
ncbi:MAG: response regulator [Kiritimatiellae bacterium]|nr:response regulator [Kiritimatiellia bacterium]